jgi:hypothetical protein
MASAQRLLPPVIVEDEGGACEQPWRAVFASFCRGKAPAVR